MTAPKFLSSSWVPRMSRHCTSGRPASIITENWRVKTARLFGLTPFLRLRAAVLADAAAFSFTGLILVTITCSRRKAATAASIVSATRSPVTFCPARVRPLYANVAIVVSCLSYPSHLPRGRADRPGTLQARARNHAHAAIDQILQFVAVRRLLERVLERHLLALVQRRQRLIHRLHAHLFLAGLHRRVDLVDLV